MVEQNPVAVAKNRKEGVFFCYCGLYLDKHGYCPRHGAKIIQLPLNPKRGKWSGPTKRYKGAYDAY